MWELIAFAVLTGMAGESVKQIKQALKPGKGNAKKTSDFKRRKAAAKKKGRARR